MGQVVPFIARVRDSGDWTATERARLEELADRLAAGGVHVEVIFGATDEGDPWCVVTDQDGDVLIHVARIDGKFVVHSAVDDAVNESVDLHTALRDRLAATEEAAPESATILPFSLSARQGQTFLALVAAAAFFYETAAIGDTAEAGEVIHALPDAPPPPPTDADAPAQEREVAAQGGVSLQPTSPGAPPPALGSAPPPAAPTEPVDTAPPPAAAIEAPAAAAAAKAEVLLTAAPAEPPVAIHGTAGDDLLVGTAANEHILGGDGADTLRGGGGHDTLDGGAGDDRIEIAADTVAIGGAGADSFVVQAPVQMGRPDTLLGVILDFNGDEGDRLFSYTGAAIKIPPRPPETADKVAPPTDSGFTTTARPNPPTDPLAPTGGDDFRTLVGPALTRVNVDLDGDGVVDGYVLVRIISHPHDDPPITVVGQSFGSGDPVG